MRQNTPEMNIHSNGNGNGNGNGAIHLPHVGADQWADVRKLAFDYHQLGSIELGKIARGETEAKDAVLLAPPTGNATMLAGPPAGGKSMLGRHGTNVIEGIDADHTAFVPPMMDMTQQQFAGGEVKTHKKVNNHTEDTVTIIEGIVKPTSRKIFGDETPRQNPYVQNSSLSIAEEGVLMTSQGEIPMDDLVAYIGTMNAADTRQGSIKPSHAFAARHGIGVLVGKTMSREEKKEILNDRAKGLWKPRPDAMETVISLQGIKMIRAMINDDRAIGVNNEMADYLSELSLNAEDVLENYTGEEVWRLHRHALTNAKALAAFDHSGMLEAKHIARGIKYAIVGRVAILATGTAAKIKTEVDDAVTAVIGQSI